MDAELNLEVETEGDRLAEFFRSKPKPRVPSAVYVYDAETVVAIRTEHATIPRGQRVPWRMDVDPKTFTPIDGPYVFDGFDWAPCEPHWLAFFEVEVDPDTGDPAFRVYWPSGHRERIK